VSDKVPKKWNFLSNYGLVLTHLFQNPRATLREIARGTDLTERAVYQIVRELETNHFIQKKRVGRRNTYTVDRNALFSFPVYRDLNIAQMVAALRHILDETKEGRDMAAVPIAPIVAN
jgi:DNA-binding Lrp family transcriptional regulator